MIAYLCLFFGSAIMLFGFALWLMIKSFTVRKKLIWFISVPALILMFTGVILNVLGKSGNSMLFLSGSFVLTFVSIPLYFKARYDKWKYYARTTLDTFFLSFFDSLGTIVLLIGLLFRFMNWPLANKLVGLGVILILINSFIWNIKFKKEVIYRKSAEDKLKDTLKEIELQKRIVDERNREITESITYARSIQNAILPPQKLFNDHFSDFFILYRPKDIVAGDFYWFEKTDNRIYFTAADCTGHGVPGAMVSVMCSNALSKVVKEKIKKSPAEILDAVVLELEEQFSKSERVVQDGMDLAFCCFDTINGSLQYAGANNPLYLVSNATLTEIKGDAQPVGSFSERKQFTNHTINLQAGDCIYIFTDGFADQFGGPNGKKFKSRAFRELILENAGKSMDEQCRLLESAFIKWQGQHEQVDDVCMIGIRFQS